MYDCKTIKYVQLEVDNNVPYFIPETRPDTWRDLAARGFIREVRMMESLSPEQLEESVRRFRENTEVYAKTRVELAKGWDLTSSWNEE